MNPSVTLLLATVVVGWHAEAATTINPVNKFAYAANAGWLDWHADATHGAAIGSYVCSGWIFSANFGWINLGSGTPVNGIQYQNHSASDFGVNLTADGKLRGYAYAANIGWLNFENNGDPHVDLLTGKFGGSVYSANCGWISLNNASALVQTDELLPGLDSDGDGLPDAWELTHFGTLSFGPNDDTDGDGATNLQEYLAGTDPNDPASVLAITSYTTAPGGTATTLTWRSVMTRNYVIEQSLDLKSWFDSGLGLIAPAGPATTEAFPHPYSPSRFFRVHAVNPLAP